MYSVAFIILHYLTYEDTIECVESILKNVKYDNYNIIIVDNASFNQSIEKIKFRYKNNSSIYIIYNHTNLGFAKGNNIGYIYAKEKLESDFIIAMNNDTIIQDSEFINQIIDYYNNYKFHILGPDIISLKDNMHQNPLRNIINSRFKLIKNILKYSLLVIMNITKLEDIKNKVKKNYLRYSNKIEKLGKEQNNEILENVPLHGACLVFSPLFKEIFDYVFYPNTFLYMEEDILYYICNKKDFKTIYFPKIKVYHKEDSSTDFLLNKESKKRRFIYINLIKSSFVFYKLIKNKDI